MQPVLYQRVSENYLFETEKKKAMGRETTNSSAKEGQREETREEGVKKSNQKKQLGKGAG